MSSKIIAGTTSSTALNMSADTSGVLEIQTGSTPTTAVTIDTSQKVGIGTASPQGLLDISSSNTYTPFFISSTYVGNAAQRNWAIGTSVNSFGDLSFNTSNAQGGNPISAGTTRMMIDSSGNVGIGTNTISAPNGRVYNLQIGTNNAGSSSELLLGHQGDGFSLFTSGGSGAGALSFSQGTSEKMRIDSSGNLLVGCTSRFSTIVQGIQAQAAGSASIALSRTADNGAVARFFSTSTEVGNISVTGSTTTFNSTSDYRLKENVLPMIGALDKVSQLKPVTYVWKNTGDLGQGFIAHELAEVCPDAVTGEKDAVNEDGSIKAQGIDTAKIVGLLTAAIQELNAKVDAQAAEIATLKGTA